MNDNPYQSPASLQAVVSTEKERRSVTEWAKLSRQASSLRFFGILFIAYALMTLGISIFLDGSGGRIFLGIEFKIIWAAIHLFIFVAGLAMFRQYVWGRKPAIIATFWFFLYIVTLPFVVYLLVILLGANGKSLFLPDVVDVLRGKNFLQKSRSQGK